MSSSSSVSLRLGLPGALVALGALVGSGALVALGALRALRALGSLGALGGLGPLGPLKPLDMLCTPEPESGDGNLNDQQCRKVSLS